MSENKFDEHIKKKLLDHEQDYDPASWDLLNKRLDQDLAADIDDDEFDQEVADKLNSHRLTPSHEDWLMMKEELEIVQERKEKVIVAKFIEIVTILLLVLTFNNYRSLTFPKDRVDHDYTQSIRLINEDASKIQASAELDLNLEQRILESMGANREDGLRQNRSTELTSILLTNASHSLPKLTLKKEQIDLSHAFIYSEDHFDWKADMDRVPLLDIQALSVEIELPQLEVIPIFAFEKRKKNMNGWSIGIPLSVDANFVNTDFNFNILRSQVKYGLSGTSLGINAAYRSNGLELETGLEYSVKKFAPGLIRNYSQATRTGNTLWEEQLELVTFKQFQIPLLLKAYLSPKEKISFYGTVGIAANFLLDTDYELSAQTVAANLRPASALNHKILDLSDPPAGLIQGGSLKDNLYVTSIIGFGVQQYFPNGFAWYIQPQYQYSLTKNINEVASEVNSLSLELGIKYKL